MTPFSPLFAPLIFAIAFGVGYLIKRKYASSPSINRFETIDGLRGFLGVSVFIHHATIWYSYLHTGEWTMPSSHLYSHLGQTSVALFFMISGFLFINQLMNYQGANYNWRSFFVKRFFRLVPLHFFVLLVILILVGIQSDWTLNVSYSALTSSMLKWFGFGIWGLGEINNIKASLISAGVVWSLSYEWLFYCSLPLVSLFILKQKPKIFYLLSSLAFIVCVLSFRSFSLGYLSFFAGGAIAPILMKWGFKVFNFKHPIFSVTVLICLAGILLFDSPSSIYCKVLIAMAFTIIAMGNDLFGLLKSSTFKFLGDISYGTYLWHGIILFVSIHYFYGIEHTRSLSPLQYYLFVSIITPFVIVLSYITYHFIEKPFIGYARKKVVKK